MQFPFPFPHTSSPSPSLVCQSEYESLEGCINISISTVLMVKAIYANICVFKWLFKWYMMYKCIQTITKTQWVRVGEPLELLSAFVNELAKERWRRYMCVEAWTGDAKCKGGDEEVGWEWLHFEMKNRPAEGCDSEERVVRVGVNRWIMILFNQHLHAEEQIMYQRIVTSHLPLTRNKVTDHRWHFSLREHEH